MLIKESKHFPFGQFSCSVVSNSLRPHVLQHARLPCNSRSLLKLMSMESVMPSNHHMLCIPFSSCFPPFPASGSFPIGQFFASGGQSTGVSASASVLPMNIQDWFPLGWTGWISLQSKGTQESSPTSEFKNVNSSVLSFPYSPTLTSIHDHWKDHSFD